MSHAATSHAHRLAEQVTAAWYRYAPHISQRHDIAIGTVAAASLIRMPESHRADIATVWEGLDDDELVRSLRRIWNFRWLDEPYLAHAARILRDWLDEDDHDPKTLRAVRILMVTCLRGGILDLTGSHDPLERTAVDVLGVMVTRLRAEKSREALGEHHTPPDEAALMVGMMLGGQWRGADAVATLPEIGAGFCDVCAGTGGLVRATARTLYQLGGTAAHYRWYMNDVDPLAAACCAVNAITWGLGSRVLVSCADILADPDAIEKQYPVWAEDLSNQRRLWRAAAALADVLQLTNTSAPGPGEQTEASV